MAIYIVKNGGLEWLPKDMGFIPNLNINTENLSFLCFWNLTYVRKLVPAYTCLRLRMQVHACVHRPRAFFGLSFPKYIFCSLKSYIFYFNTSQVNL